MALFLRLLALCLALVTQADPPVFLIEPFLFAHQNHNYFLTWAYSQKLQALPVVQLQVKGRVVPLIATLKHDIYSVELPLPQCNFGDVSYQVSGMKGWVQIQDVPCANQEADFALIADPQKHIKPVVKIVSMLETAKISNVIIAGDLVQEGTNTDLWQNFFAALNPLSRHRIIVPVIGNHEYWNDNVAANWNLFFRENPEQLFHWNDIGNVRIFTLNSNIESHPELIKPQALWLAQELAATPPQMWKFVVMHHPPFSTDNVQGLPPVKYPSHAFGYDADDDMPVASPGDLKLSQFMGSLRGREWLLLQKYFVPIFEKFGVNFVLAGHRHIYERSIKSGIQYVSAGPAGGTIAMPVTSNPYGVKLARERTLTFFHASANSVFVRTVNIDGKVIDEFKVSR